MTLDRLVTQASLRGRSRSHMISATRVGHACLPTSTPPPSNCVARAHALLYNNQPIGLDPHPDPVGRSGRPARAALSSPCFRITPPGACEPPSPFSFFFWVLLASSSPPSALRACESTTGQADSAANSAAACAPPPPPLARRRRGLDHHASPVARHRPPPPRSSSYYILHYSLSATPGP